MYSFLFKQMDKNYSKKTLIENYRNVLILMSPVIPHFSNECLEIIEIKDKITWPKHIEKLIEEDEVTIVIQINGKKRGLIKDKKNINESQVIEKINKDPNLTKYLKDNEIKKKIFIPNKLINIII